MCSRSVLRALAVALAALGVHGTIAAQVPTALSGNIHMRWGYPGGPCKPLIQPFFIICEDVPHRLPLWVGYHLGLSDLHGSAKRKDNFHADVRLAAGARAENADYAGSGYDKGHMAPAADFKRSDAAMSETFLLSNMAPQRPNLNRRIWERLENSVRQLAHDHGSIWIFTGPLYLNADGTKAMAPDSFIGHDRVAVPTHFFKVVLCENADGSYQMFAFILPNQTESFTHDAAYYLETVAKVELLSGQSPQDRLDFFAELPDARERPLEAARAARWPVP